LNSTDEHTLELPWHLSGDTEVVTPGAWLPDQLASEFVTEVQRFQRQTTDDRTYEIRSTATHGDGEGRVTLVAKFVADADFLRAKGPGAPGTSEPVTFYVLRARGRNARVITILESTSAIPSIQSIRHEGDVIEVGTSDGAHRHSANAEGWDIATPSIQIKLRGRQDTGKTIIVPLFSERRSPVEGIAVPLASPPTLDGTLDGFAGNEPLVLDYEDQYRRADEPYPGPDDFSATAYVNWTEEALYVGVSVIKPSVIFRGPDAPPLRLDNDPDDIHSDGVQVYVRVADDLPVYGFLIVPSDDDGAIRVHAVAGATSEMVNGAWEPTEAGYCLTIALRLPDWPNARPGDRIGFDLLINQMEPDRLRRSGQLVWSGGGGWIWLRGDRQDPSRFGVLVLE